MRREFGCFSAIFAAICVGCSEEAGPHATNDPPVDGTGPFMRERTWASAGEGETWVGGIDDAAPKNVRVVVESRDGKQLGETMSDEHGRFVARVPSRPGDTVQLRVDDSVFSLRVRDAEVAAKEAVLAPLTAGAGSVPNDLAIITTDGGALGIVARSGDDALGIVLLDDANPEPQTGVRLPTELGPANPWFLAPIARDGHRVAATAFLQQRVYIVDIDSRRVAASLEVTARVSLDEPYTLSRSIDVDGDGASDLRITKLLARSPQGILAHENRLYVAYSGFVGPRFGNAPPVYVPSVLATWNLDDLAAPPSLLLLPDMNAQDIHWGRDGQLWIVCSGIIDTIYGAPTAATPGAIVSVDPDSMRVRDRVVISDFAPGSVVAYDGLLWTSSLIRPEIRAFDAATHEERHRVTLNEEAVDSIFRLVEIPGGFLFAPSFNTDRLHVIDARTGELNPRPFLGPLRLGPGRPIFDGLSIVARRSGRAGVDFVGPDFYALSSIASRVTPVSLRKIFGP